MAARRLRPKHKRELARIIKKIQKYFGKLRIYPRGHVFLDRVVLAHVSKGLTVGRGVLCLVDAGLPEEAFGLSRTLVEVALNLRFITNKYSERRARRFVHFYAVWKTEQIRRAVKHFKGGEDERGRALPDYTKAQVRAQVKNNLWAKLARKFPDHNNWTLTRNRKASRGGVWKMAVELDKHEKIGDRPATWEFDYDWIYFWTSQYVHASVACMDSHVVFPREAFSADISPQQGEHTAELAVFNVALYLTKVLVMAFRALKYDFRDELSHPLGELLDEIGEESRRRNEKRTSISKQ